MTAVFDVAIVGGGPGGTLLGYLLARRGRSVVVVDRGTAAGPTLETLASEGQAILAKHGLTFDDCAQVSARTSSWGAESRFEQLMFPSGLGAFVDRETFDLGLRAAAAAQGADIRSGHVRSAEWTRETWTLGLSMGDLRSRFLVDASGRACWLARRRVGPPLVYDELVGVRVAADGDLGNRETHLVASADGWTFSLNVDGRREATLFTDIDQRGRVGAACSTRSARSQRAAAVAGEGWCAIGDAACAFDPLSSNGVTSALRDAEALADLLSLNADVRNTDTLAYADSKRKDYIDYLARRRRYYRLEWRWNEHLFWARRH